MEETRTLISYCTGAIEAASQTAINAQELALRNAEIIKVLVNKVDQLVTFTLIYIFLQKNVYLFNKLFSLNFTVDFYCI